MICFLWFVFVLFVCLFVFCIVLVCVLIFFGFVEPVSYLLFFCGDWGTDLPPSGRPSGARQ